MHESVEFQPDSRFDDFLSLVGEGDESAVDAFFRRYEPELRRLIRMRLHHSQLRSIVDSVDVTQSVMMKFVSRLRDGEYRGETPQGLFRLLSTMAQNKLIDWYRKESRRGLAGRQQLEDVDIYAKGPTPYDIASSRDLLDAAHRQMTAEERYIVERRAEGAGWRDIGNDLSTNHEALRKKLNRSLVRIADELEVLT